MGGLARKATVIDKLRSEGFDVLILDAGNLFFKKETLEPGVGEDVAKLTAEIIVKSFNKIGCDVFSPGAKDFAAGLDFVKKMQENANFPFISANIQDLEENLLFKPYKIVEKEGLNIGVIGLSSKFVHPDILVKDPISSLLEYLPQLQNECDIIVLLFDSDEKDIRSIQANNYNIDLIIRSKSKKRSKDGGTGNILEYSCGDRGKYLYQYDLIMVESGGKFRDLGSYENLKSNAQNKLNRMKKDNLTADLKVIYKDDLQSLRKIETYEAQISEANLSISRFSQGNIIKMTKHELGKSISDRSDILKIVDEGKLNIVNIHGPQPPPGAHKHIRHDHDGDGIPDH